MEYRLKYNPNGQVEKEVFEKGINDLRLAYPSWKMDLRNKQSVRLIYSYTGYCTNDQFAKGISNYIKNERFEPTIASLIKYIPSEDKRYPRKETCTVELNDDYVDMNLLCFENGLNVIDGLGKSFVGNSRMLLQEDLSDINKDLIEPCNNLSIRGDLWT